jgi:small-conductance mechanosensitive channel
MRQLFMITFLLLVTFALPAQEEQAPAPVATSDLATEIETTISDNPAMMGLPLAIRFGIAAAIVIIQMLLIRVWYYFSERIKKKVAVYAKTNLKPIKIKKLQLVDTDQMLNVIFVLLKILNIIVTVFQLFITLPIVFSLFERTKNLASTIFGYILNPLKATAMALFNYIPNAISIVVIIVIIVYTIRVLRFFTIQIERKKLVIPGFYYDWAQPTFQILRVLLYAFMIIIIYPLLPNSESAIFQGVSMFIGVIFSLGSSSVIGNLVAGIVVTYMRPFKIGDRIKIGDVIGFVVEKSATVTRIRTHKNEYVTFPNMTILTSNITNYNYSATEKEEGLMLYLDVTMGYIVPWRTMHTIMLGAAEKTQYVLKTPKPFILQTAFEDFYCRYQLNVFIKEVAKIPAIYSELYQNLQDGFVEAGVSLTAPHFQVYMPPHEE